MIPLLALMACGQFVNAEDALTGAATVGTEVDLPSRDELAEVATLNHYGQDAILRLHSATETWNGGEMRAVDYTAMAASPEARLTIADSLANLAAVDPTLLETREEKIAFYMNLYNLWAIQYVLDHLDEEGFEGASTDNFVAFSTDLVQLDGFSFTLNGIEHGLVRGDAYAFSDEGWISYFADEATRDHAWALHEDLWGGDVVDSRMHMGFNCFSRSCPDVTAGAWRAATLDEDFVAASQAFLAHPGKGAGPDGISYLFNWYAADFTASHGSPEAFIEQYRDGGLDGVDTSQWLEYDWALNGG